MVCDLNALGKGAGVIPPIAASFDPQAAARRFRKRVDHVWRNGTIAGAIKRNLYPLSVGRCLISDRFSRPDMQSARTPKSTVRLPSNDGLPDQTKPERNCRRQKVQN
ncbi:hypothetical protein [Frigidibacter mobilis]|uniref:hypothetical protein n=1 Tax=Frigidibacter mobilis TaxID=1335048 RepID=UPI00141329FE|nr:hypothetical protein [Frigidibacter mobilis]